MQYVIRQRSNQSYFVRNLNHPNLDRWDVLDCATVYKRKADAALSAKNRSLGDVEFVRVFFTTIE